MNSQKKLLLPFFILTFIGVSLFFGYHQIFNYPPSGSHTWRQTDCTSIVLRYFQNGMNFFEPQVQHTLNGESKAAPSEFPILYYLTAAIFHLTGKHDGVLRVIDILILFLGFFGLSKITFGLTKDLFYSLAVPLILIASPVVGYYGFNYIPNIPALGLSFLGSYFFYQFYISENRKWWIASIATFLFAGLIKIPTLIPFVAIFCVFFLEKLNWINFKSEGNIFKKGWWNLLAPLIVFGIIASWVFWMIQYNETNKCGIFLAKAKPIWSLVEPQITETWHWIIQIGAPQYHHRITRYFIFGAAFCLFFFFRKKQSKLLYTFNVLIFLGAMAGFILFYRQFFVHDYYSIELMVFPAMVLITFFSVLKNSFPKISNHVVTKILFTVFIGFNLMQTRGYIQDRYDPEFKNNKSYNYSFYKTKELQSFLTDLGINYPDKVIAMEDVSPNTLLYYYNLTGWTGFAINERPFPPKLTNHFLHDWRAEYLIISDASYLKHENVIPFLDHHLGTFDNSIFVYDLKPYRRDYSK